MLCVGSSQALTTVEPPGLVVEALRALRGLVADGGGCCSGRASGSVRRPRPSSRACWPGASATDHYDLGTLLDLTVEAGFRPEWTETADAGEWEEFESAYQADTEVWLAENPGHPRAAGTRERLDRHRAQWMSYRGILGLAYLTLVPAR